MMTHQLSGRNFRTAASILPPFHPSVIIITFRLVFLASICNARLRPATSCSWLFLGSPHASPRATRLTPPLLCVRLLLVLFKGATARRGRNASNIRSTQTQNPLDTGTGTSARRIHRTHIIAHTFVSIESFLFFLPGPDTPTTASTYTAREPPCPPC
jgi:hypothetical protein